MSAAALSDSLAMGPASGITLAGRRVLSAAASFHFRTAVSILPGKSADFNGRRIVRSGGNHAEWTRRTFNREIAMSGIVAGAPILAVAALGSMVSAVSPLLEVFEG
jgi:hypothetical protein